MANITPNELFPGITLSGNSLVIPLAALDGLSTTEANPTTGDGRKVAFELVKAIVNRYTGLSPTSRPTRMSVASVPPIGMTATIARRSYTLNFDVDVSQTDIADEPT